MMTPLVHYCTDSTLLLLALHAFKNAIYKYGVLPLYFESQFIQSQSGTINIGSWRRLNQFYVQE